MKLQLKRSSVADGSSQDKKITASGAAKVPSELQMKFGELAINYSDSDPTIFMKKEDGKIVEPYFKKDSLHRLTELGH